MSDPENNCSEYASVLRAFSQVSPCVLKITTIGIVSYVFVYIKSNIFYCKLPLYFYVFKCLGPFCFVIFFVPVGVFETELVLDSVKVIYMVTTES